MRPSRSHESLSSSPMKHHKSATLLTSSNKSKLKDINQTPTSSSLTRQSINNNNNKKNNKKIENILKLNLNSTSEIDMTSLSDSSNILINQIHTSFFNEENCFELKCFNNTISVFKKKRLNADYEESADSYEEEDFDYNSSNELDSIQQQNGRKNSTTLNNNNNNTNTKYYNSSEFYSSHYFMCRSSEEREKWVQCFRNVAYPNLANERHSVNSLQVWLLEAKGLAISTKPTKKYFCQVLINNNVYGRTCSKHKKDILFWGENFDFK
jgi:hypothetical protein